MKKLLTFLVPLFMYFGVPAQIQDVETKTVKDWDCEQRGHWGSFWWKVERTVKRQEDGNYYYYVYMQSNSYFNTIDSQGKYPKSTSYIESPVLLMLEDRIEYNYELNFEYLLFDWEKTYIAYFYHPSPIKRFGIRYGSVSPYSYTRHDN